MTGEELYKQWCNAPGSDSEAYWPLMNRAHKAKWNRLATLVAPVQLVHDLRVAIADLDSAHNVYTHAALSGSMSVDHHRSLLLRTRERIRPLADDAEPQEES